MEVTGLNNVYVDPLARIDDSVLINAVSGKVYVGEYAFIAHRVMILTGTHDYNEFDEKRQQFSPLEGRDVYIGRGAWIASGAIIVGPCHIGDHSVVAAGAVVTKDVPPYSVVAGNPAKVIKMIKSHE